MERLRYLRLTRRQRLCIWLTLIVTVLAALCGVAMMQMKPILTSMATARVSNTVSRIIVSAVDDAVMQGEIDYETLISFEKDGSGCITALRSNMAAFNRLQAEISQDVLRRLAEVSDTELSVPLGTLTGSALLAGRGPALHVKMQSLGSAQASFRNTFTAAGINQTRHQILLTVDVDVSILLPMIRTSTRVSHEIAVAETVIVGSVPESYTLDQR